MAAEKGSTFLLKKGTVGTATTIAGMRTTSITINGETVDVTNKDSAGVRTLLAGAGVTSMSISAEGVFQDDTEVKDMRTACIAMSLDDYVIEYGNGDTIAGLFQVTSFENSGEYNGELTFSVSLESSGVFTVVDNV